MSTAFNLTAQLNLRGPTNVRNIVSSIRRQLGTISTDVNLRIDPAANRNLTQLNSALNTFNTTLRTTQSNVNNTTNALRGLATAIGAINSNGLPRNMTAMATSANRAAQATSRVTTQVEASRNQMEEFGRQSALAIRRFAAFSLSTGIIFGFTNALNKGLKAFVDFDKELVKLQQVTGESAQGLAGLQKTISSLSTGLGVSSSELINVSSTLAQAGLSARDTEKALRALALSSLAPSFDDMNKTVEGSIALMRQFGISAGELDQALGSVNAVAAKFAVEASDIIAAIQRTGGVFAAASKGVSEGTQALNEFIAVFTSIRATTRESAETIATGLRTIFTRVQRGETIEALKQYGVNLTDLEGKFVGAYKAVELLSRGLNTIDPRDLRFSQIVEELGGFRQIGKVIPLIQQFATAQQALAVAQRGQGSLAEDAAVAQLSLANQISKVREEFLTLIRDIGGTDTFQTIAKSALGLASALIKVADSVKGIIPVLGVVMAIRGTAALSSYARGFAGGLRGAPRRGAAKGGIIKYASGGDVKDVDVALMPGETVVYPDMVNQIGVTRLRQLNNADRNGVSGKKTGGKISKFSMGGYAQVPGTGRTDSFYTTLPEGSFVIRTDATSALGGPEGVVRAGMSSQKFAKGGDVQKFKRGTKDPISRKPGKTTKSGSVFMHLDPGPEIVPDIRSATLSGQSKVRGLSNIGISLDGLGPIINQKLKDGNANISKKDFLKLISRTSAISLFKKQLQLESNTRSGAGTFRDGKKSKAHGILSDSRVQKMLKKALLTEILSPRIPDTINSDRDIYGLGKSLISAARNIDPELASGFGQIRELTYKDPKKYQQRLERERIKAEKEKRKAKRVTGDVRPRFGGKYQSELSSGLLSLREDASFTGAYHRNGGAVQKFVKGDKVTSRNVGYIDSDEISGLLKDPVKGPLIKAEMDRLGIKGVADFKEHLSNLAASRRKSGDLKRLTNIFGVAGSGKSTMVQGGSRAKEADNARLRKTTRYPILTEADLLRSDQVIDSTSVAGPSQRNTLSSADRIIALSSRTKDSQEILKRQRKARDASGKNLFGRKPGATKSAPLDSGIGEAYIAATEVSGVDSRKVRTLKIGENFKKIRTNQPSVRTPDKTGLFYGNFGPATAGHADAILEASKKAGIPTKDFVALVGGDTPIDPFSKDPHDRRTALFPQKAEDNRPSRVGMAKSVFGAIGANVSAMPRGSGPGSIPPAFKIGDDNYIVPKGTGDVAVVGDEKDPKSLDKYTKLGYKTMSLPRLGGISGTKAREAIANNDIPSLKKLLTKEGFDYVQQHIQTLQKRPQLIDAILDRIQKNSDKGRGVAGRLSSTKSALSELPSRVTKTTPPEIATKIESLRKDREALSSKLGRLPSKLVSRLEKRQRFGRGSTKPLKPISEMRRRELMDEAISKGISYDYELLGLRRPLTADESARKAKFLKDLEDSRIVTQQQAAKTSARAKKRNIAVVGITGDNDAQEIVTPGIKSKRGKKGMSGVPATLQTGTLPPEIAKKVQAIIRNRSERIVSAVASVIAGAAGTTQVKDRKGIRSILSKQLPDISGLLFESGLAAAGAPYDPSSKAIDFNKGLGKELAGLFGIDPKALTDATNDATQEQARRKVKKGQFDRGRRDAIRAKKAKTPRQKFGKGGLAFTDFDMTAAVSKQKETPSLSGFKNPSLAVPDIMNASPTGLLKLLRQDYGGVGVLTARSGGPKGEMKKALQTFFKKNGIMVPASRLITLGDQIEDVPTPEKKARELHRLVKKYGRIDYFDDREDIVGAAKEVKGVNARRIKVRRAVGGSIPSPMNNASLSRSSKDKRLDPKKLAAFLGSETPITKKQEELLKQLKDKTSVISKPNYEELLKGLNPKKYARGGEVPIMAKEGEYVINRKSAKAIGYGNLHRLNKYHSGGKVQKLAAGGPLDTAMATMSARDSNKLKATMAANTRAFEKLEKGVQGWPIDAVQAAMKKLARALERGEKNFTFDQKNYNKNNPSARKNKKERVGPQGKAAGSGTSNALTSAANLEANKAKTIVDLQNYEKTQYQKARKQGKTAQEARESSKAAAIARATKISQPMSKQEERALTAQAMRKARASGASNDNARRAGQNALNKAKAQQSARLQGAAIFNTASMTGDQTAVRNTLGGVNNNSSAASSSGGGGGGGGGRSGKRRGSSSRGGQQPDRDNNGRIMGMGRLTQAGFGISMMGGLGSQFFNPESSASNAANAAFTESFTSTIGMGATVAGSIGDLIPGRDDDGNKKKKRPKGSNNRGASTPTRPPASPPRGGSGGGSVGGSGGGRRGGSGGGPRVSSGGGSAGGGGGAMGMLGSVGGVLAGVAVVGLAVAEGLKAAHNAAKEFAINLANTRLEESLEKANKSIEKFSNNLSDKTLASKAKEQTLSAIKSADALDTASSKAQAGLVNLNDAMEGGAGSYERSQILNSDQGISGYLSSISLGGTLRSEDQAQKNQSARFQELIPKISGEKAKRYTGASEASSSFLDAKIRSGSNLDQIKREDPADFSKLTKSLALADSAIQEQIMSIQNSTSLTAEQKKKTIDSIIAQDGEKKAREIQTKALRDKALENLNKTTNRLQNSLERMFQNMDQAINANIASLDKLSNQAELTTASLSGQAKIGTNTKLDSVVALDNPRAFDNRTNQKAISQASSIFGAESNKMSGLLQLAGKLEGSLMSTINKTLKENKGSTNEAVGAKLDTVISNSLNDLKIPDDVALNLGKEMSMAIQEMRKKGEDKVDFSELTERIPQLSKVVESSKRAHEIAKRALEQWQGAVNEYASAINQITEIQVEASMRSRRANDIIIQGQNDLQRALGKEISLRNTKNNTLQGFSAQTGGLSDPRDVGRNIRNLEGTRAEQQSLFNNASNKGPGSAGEVKMMGDELLKTNLALRENYDALKNMADNTDIASAALNKISEIRQQRQAGVGFAEKLVSSTPKELANLNMSMARLQNNMAGRMNISNPSQRAGDLQLFNELAPLLGDKQSEMKANVLENMLKESGVGVSPMMQDVLDSLRNPEADPAMREAIETYKQGVTLQANANTELSKISQLMLDNNADIAAKKLVQSLQGVTLSFDSQRLSDINQGIQLLLAEVKKHNGVGMVGGAGPIGKARGGLIYASEGTMVDFQPKGTDTVPAMLTPGEFVVNRKSTQKNLGLLKQINGAGYSSGGQVKYYADGGYVFGRGWSPLKDDKETADEAQKRASGRYNAVSETETKDYLPALNWKELNKLTLEDAWTLKDAPSYIVNNSPDMLTRKWLFPGATASDIDINQSGLEWKLGASTESFSLPLGGGAGVSSLKVISKTRPGTIESIKIPSLEWMTNINNPSDRIKIHQGDLKNTLEMLNNFANKIGQKGGLPDISDKSDALNIISDGKTINLSKNTGGIIPSTEPSIKTTSSGGRLTVSGLSKQNKSNLYSLLLNSNQKTQLEGSTDKGNFISARQDFTSVGSAILEGVPYLLLKGMREQETGILGTAITAGRSTGSNPTGLDSWNFGEALSKNVHPNTLSKNIMDSLSSNITSLSNIPAIKEKVFLAIKQLSDPNNFSQSSESVSSQEYSRKLQALAEGIVFKQTFDENELKPARGAGPYTLYNMTSPDDITKWKMATQSEASGTYAATDRDFIPIYRFDAMGGVEGQPFKRLPWVNAGFSNMNFLNNIENKKAEEKINATVAKKLYKGKHVSFPYNQIVSQLWNKDKKRLDGNKETFNTIDVGGVVDQNNPNPFNELLLPNNLFSIRTDNPEALGRYLDDQAVRLQGKQFSLRGTTAHTISRVDGASEEVAKYGILDPTIKDHLYIRSNDRTQPPDWITQQYEQLFLAKQKREKAEKDAALGQQGIANKANIADQDMPENPLLLVEQARSIVGKVLAPISGILSAYNIKLAPIRTASQITPYGTRLLDAQKFFASSVTEKFKNNKKPIDQRLWDVWGALGATGKVFQKLGEGDKQGLQTLLGAAAGTLGNTTSLGDMVIRYGQLLAAQGSTFSGIAGLPTPEQALKKEIGDNDKQTIEGIFQKAQTEEATVANGKLTVNKTEGKNLPTTLLDLGKKIVNPYSTFQAADRSSLFDMLIKGLSKYDNKNIKRNVNEKLVSYLQSLKNFYFSYLDPIVSGGIVPDVSMTQRISDQYPAMNGILQVLTNGEYGKMPDAKKMQELAAAKKARMEAQKKATGGIIYASTGTLVNYQPRGTDTVPAMLTPGEFVVNRAATQRNLPLLKAINSGSQSQSPKTFSRGGVVYLTEGSTEPVKSRRDQYNETMRQRREQYQETMRSRRDNYRSGTTPSPTSRGAPQQSAVQTAIGVKLDTKKLTEEINGIFIGAAKLLSGILNIPEADKAVLTTFSSNLKSVISQISQINIPPEIKFSMQPVQVNITGAQGLTDAANSLVDGAIQKAFIDFLSINDLNGTYKPPGEGE